MNKKLLNTIRRISAFTLVSFLLFTSIACGSSSPNNSGVTPDTRGEGAADFDDDKSGGESGGAGEDNIDLDRKIITNTNIRMESPDVTEAVNELSAYARELGGYIQSEYQRESGGSYYGELVVRIPAATVDDFVSRTGDFGEIKENKVSIQDVTADYTDTASRLANAKVQETRLLAMFEEANTIDELLYIQAELDRLQERIEVYEGQIRLWDNLIDMATVSLNIYEEAALIEEGSSIPRYIPANTVWERFSNGVQSSVVHFVNGVSRFIIWLGSSLIQILFMLLLALVVFFIVRRWKKRSLSKTGTSNVRPASRPYNNSQQRYPSQPVPSPYQETPNPIQESRNEAEKPTQTIDEPHEDLH